MNSKMWAAIGAIALVVIALWFALGNTSSITGEVPEVMEEETSE